MTVQSQMLRLAQRIDPQTKNSQTFQDLTAGTAITGATNATPIVITSVNHGLITGNQVYISGVLVNTNANNNAANPHWTITRITADTFSLQDDSGNNIAGNGVYTSGGTVTGALIGSVDGNFTRQRLLDIYNDARFVLFGELKRSRTLHDLTEIINGNVVSSTTLAFSSGSANKPSGYIRSISLMDSSNVVIPILPASWNAGLLSLQQAGNRFVNEIGSTLVSPTAGTYIADGNYKLLYYGITNFTLAQVLDGTTTETYIEDFQYILLEIAEAIGLGKGLNEVQALTQKLLGGG